MIESRLFTSALKQALASGALPKTTALVTVVCMMSAAVRAESLPGALAKAYINNPNINQQRASLRATDENVPRANSGYLPTVSATGSLGIERLESRETSASFGTSSSGGAGGLASVLGGGTAAGSAATGALGVGGTTGNSSVIRLNATTFPRNYGLTLNENIYNGNRTENGVRQAESNVLGGREQLRNVIQNTLQSGATFYMDVLRDTAIFNLDRNNVDVLLEQLRQTRDRFKVGEVTRTDVAQAESSLANGRSQALTAQSNLRTSIANYRQIIGVDPRMLEPGRPIDRLLPRTLENAVTISQVEHPSIAAALHGVDVAQLNVEILQGGLLPTFNVQGSVEKAFDTNGTPVSSSFIGSVVGSISIPIYDGGLTYANVRQAKEQVGQQRLVADQQRDIVRQAVVSAWGIYSNSKAQIESAQAQVSSAEIALNGVREEARVGQRTTLDVLNAQQVLLNARVALVTAQHDRVVASYALLAAIGRLSVESLGLRVQRYEPVTHFNQVKDKWYGLRTPGGR